MGVDPEDVLEELRRSERRYRSLVENIPGSVIILFGRDLRILLVDGPEVEASGASKTRMEGKLPAECLPPEFARIVERNFQAVIDGARFSMELPWQDQIYHYEYVPLRDERGEVEHGLVVGQNVTQRVRADALRQQLEEQLHHAMKMDAIGRLAGGIAHDFNNLLTAILGNIDLARAGLDAGDPRAADLDEAREAAGRAAALVGQLLAFSRKQEIKPAVVELDQLLGGCVRMLTRLLGATVNVIASPSRAPVWVRVDPGKLEQVLINLAINARDAMPDGGDLVFATDLVPELPEGLEGPAGPHVRIEISDTGTGMSPETLAHLFEPFFTTKGPGKGTGLGLSIVYGIVKQSDGHIRVRSQPGKGTTFEILLPVAMAETAQPAPALADAPPAGVGRVLVVEDDEQVLRAIERCLRRQGYDLLVTSNPDEALAHASDPAVHIDLLVTDLVMPKLDGIALRDRIVGARPDLPVLFISGDAEPALLSRATTCDRAWFLAKPFSIDEILARVRDILGDRVSAPASSPPA